MLLAWRRLAATAGLRMNPDAPLAAQAPVRRAEMNADAQFIGSVNRSRRQENSRTLGELIWKADYGKINRTRVKQTSCPDLIQ